jgi:hypothetical protein
VNILLAVLIGFAFALGSLSALTAGSNMKSSTGVNTNNTVPVREIDMLPLGTLNTDQLQAARTKAKDRWAKMTSEEQSNAIKVARAKSPGELTALDELAKQGFWTRWLGLPWRIPPKPTTPPTDRP